MIDKIFKLFFSEVKSNKNITVIRRDVKFYEKELITKRKPTEKHSELTCLSKYFVNLKGLNLLEREKIKI